MKTPYRCVQSDDMQHDIFRSDHDLDFRSNFSNDFLMSNDSSFDASKQNKRDAGKMNVVSLLSQKSSQKMSLVVFRKIDYFVSVLLSGSQTVDISSNLRTS